LEIKLLQRKNNPRDNSKLMNIDWQELGDKAIEAALAAGKVINSYREKDLEVETKEGASSYAAQVVTEVDRAAEKVILDILEPTCKTYDLAMLSEESVDDGSRFEKDFFWCIDPMDGTLPFINKEPGFSVAIALVAKDGSPHLGVVYDPSTENLYHAIKGLGAFKNHKPWHIEKQNNFLSYITDRKLADTPQKEIIEDKIRSVLSRLGLDQVVEISGGGSIINAIRSLESGPAFVLKLPKKIPGGSSLWDFAATAAIYTELGLPVGNAEGGPLDLNRKDSCYMNHEGVSFENL